MLTAAPTRLETLRVDGLAPRALVDWLRQRLLGQRGLVVALLAYDAGRNLERVPATAREEPRLPDVVVASYDAWLQGPTDHGPWQLDGPCAHARDRLAGYLAADAPPEAAEPHQTVQLTSSMTRAEHATALADVLEGIAAGDLYQANIARRLEAPLDPRRTPALYQRLRSVNPAAFGALWDLGEGQWLASQSPECLLTWDPATRAARSYPIKGTRRRSADPATDHALAAELLADPKERAEHLMIVDLVRNDLGRVAEPGGVRVGHLFGLQTLPTVHHLVSEVIARARGDVDLADVVAALFPGGSVTGAPKIAAMARIERVEGLRRGFYTGSLGLVHPDGRATFSILIRTCVVADGRVLYQTGGGIVADSDPAREWEETALKAAALTDTLEFAPP